MGRKQGLKGIRQGVAGGTGRRQETQPKSVNPSPMPCRFLLSSELLHLQSGWKKGRKLSPTSLLPRPRHSPNSSSDASARHQSNVSALPSLPKDIFDPSPASSVRRKANRSIDCVSPLSASGRSRPHRFQMQAAYSPIHSPALSLPRSLHRSIGRAVSSRSASPSPLLSLQTYFQAFHQKSRELLRQLERRVLG